MKNKSTAFLPIFIFLVFSISHAQENLTAMFLDRGKVLPATLLSENSVCFITINENPESSAGAPQPMDLIKNLHQDFNKLGINVVSYYSNDVLLNFETKNLFMEDMKKNNVKNIVSVLFASLGETYVLSSYPYNGKEPIANNNEKAYSNQAKSYAQMMEEFTKILKKASLKSSNHSYTEEPNIVYLPNAVKGNFFEKTPNDLSSKILLLPFFEQIGLPDEKPKGLINRLSYTQIEKFNETIEKNNKKLSQILSKYPYKFKLVSYYKEYGNYKDAKDVYLLSSFTGTEEVKKIIFAPDNIRGAPWQKRNNENKIKTTLVPMVYYYIKDISNNDIYWWNSKGDNQWDDALKNFINSVIK